MVKVFRRELKDVSKRLMRLIPSAPKSHSLTRELAIEALFSTYKATFKTALSLPDLPNWGLVTGNRKAYLKSITTYTQQSRDHIAQVIAENKSLPELLPRPDKALQARGIAIGIIYMSLLTICERIFTNDVFIQAMRAIEQGKAPVVVGTGGAENPQGFSTSSDGWRRQMSEVEARMIDMGLKSVDLLQKAHSAFLQLLGVRLPDAIEGKRRARISCTHDC
jgi:hypothetical protein